MLLFAHTLPSPGSHPLRRWSSEMAERINGPNFFEAFRIAAEQQMLPLIDEFFVFFFREMNGDSRNQSVKWCWRLRQKRPGVLLILSVVKASEFEMRKRIVDFQRKVCFQDFIKRSDIFLRPPLSNPQCQLREIS